MQWKTRRSVNRHWQLTDSWTQIEVKTTNRRIKSPNRDCEQHMCPKVNHIHSRCSMLSSAHSTIQRFYVCTWRDGLMSGLSTFKDDTWWMDSMGSSPFNLTERPQMRATNHLGSLTSSRPSRPSSNGCIMLQRYLSLAYISRSYLSESIIG